MREIKVSSQYRKDLKKYRNQSQKLAKLQVILKMLASDESLPQKYRPHYLKGKYKGCMECHIEGDFHLIWWDEDKNTIELLRLGSHSELF
ncbi:MAG: type II toxin-antitoxin system YafQ family toxin [Draconibacterium sp.]